MKTYLQILINHFSESTPTIILHSGNMKYLFNCSENFMRFQKFNKIRCVQGMRFFLTRLSSETLDGLLPNMTNLFGTGMAIQDKVYGPHQTVNMFQAMKTKFYIKGLPYSFVGFSQDKAENNPNMPNYLLGVNDIEAIFGLQNDIDFPFHFFESAAIANDFVAKKFKKEGEANKEYFNDARAMLNSAGNYQDSEVEITPIYVNTKEEDVLAYLVKFPVSDIKINKDKLKLFNIPGKMMKDIQQNGQIELNGQTIKLEQILEDPQPAPQLLIFDCISEESVENLMHNKDIPYESSKDTFLYTVIHMTPIHLLKSKLYEEFLKKFSPETQHIFVNSHLKEDSKLNDKNLKKVVSEFHHIEVTNVVAKEFPTNFPTISDSSKAYKSEIEFVEEDLEALFPYLKQKTTPKKNYQLVFYPKKNEEWYQPINQQLNQKKQGRLDEFQNTAKKTHSSLKEEISGQEFTSLDGFIKEKTKDYNPHVYFLGTTCMMPTTYRNNSSILIYEKSLKQAMMLDCGEGTYYQLLNQFGEAECQEVLRNLKFMILTHAHSDHYMGFQSIIYQRQKAFELAKLQNKHYSKEDEEIYIALPWCLAPWYAAVDSFTEKLNCKLVYFQEFNGEKIQDLFAEYKKDEFTDKELEEQKKQEEQDQKNGDQSEDDELIKQKSNTPSKEAHKEVKQKKETEEEDEQCCDDEEEEEDDNRGHKAKVRALQLISYLNSSDQDIEQSNNEFKKHILAKLGIDQIQFIPVIHCSQAYGVVLKHTSGVKISYSGDTRPCTDFAQAAEGSDLMIHEGTFNDDLLEHAKKARHSTASEAIDIAMKANVKALVLTHLSKRHPKLDLGDFSDLSIEKNKFIKYQTSLALDHLQFQLSDYFTVPFISKCANQIFPDEK